MIITINIRREDLKKIEEMVSEGIAGNIHDFIKYSIQNQIQLEENFSKDRSTITKQGNKVEGQDSISQNKQSDIELPAKKVIKTINIKSEDIEKRTKKPIWALKNKLFPVKFVLRFIQKTLNEKNLESIPIDDLKKKMENSSYQIRKELERLDDKLDLKRGYKFSTGFPKNNEKSYNRFFKNFVIHISVHGTKIRGLPYEFGFIDVDDEKVMLTDIGAEFANLYSPVMDGFFINNNIPEQKFSEDELEYLYGHIENRTDSEKDLYRFMIDEIKQGNDNPDALNSSIKKYLEKNYPKKNGYSQTTANSIRAGLTSRMTELGLTKIIKKGGRNYYEIIDNSKEVHKDGQ